MTSTSEATWIIFDVTLDGGLEALHHAGLVGAAGPPWRQLVIDPDASFAQLHTAIQAATGWEDVHLYQFVDADGDTLCLGYDDEYAEPAPSAAEVTIRSVFTDAVTCTYRYDFGDGWSCTLTKRGWLDDADRPDPYVVMAARYAFPPEDCGGLPGYAHLAAESMWPDQDDEQSQELVRHFAGWNPLQLTGEVGEVA